MLVLKKISVKKLAIYIFIIFLMASGTGFMLYQNKRLTTRRPANVNIPAALNNYAPAAGTNEINDQAAGAPSQTSDLNKINQNSGLDLSIFSSDKFKNLRENMYIIREQPEVGKRNPFKPN
ncbi:MAG: hypothetical protein WCV70_04405 [Patescibacteria group bacterium]|jgi:hypothetical protein